MASRKIARSSRSRVLVALLCLIVVKVLSDAAAWSFAAPSPWQTILFKAAARTLQPRPSQDALILHATPYDAPPDLTSPPSNAEKSISGLVSTTLQAGKPDGERPGTNAEVTVRYTGWKAKTGEMFDTTMASTAKFNVEKIVPGWKEGVKMMKEGEKRRLWIPGILGYGEEIPGSDPMGPPLGALVFDVELIKVENPVDPIFQIVGGGLIFLVGITAASSVLNPDAMNGPMSDTELGDFSLKTALPSWSPESKGGLGL